MSPRAALTLSEVEARASAIAKLDARLEPMPPLGVVIWVHEGALRRGRTVNAHERAHTIGDQLQHAAAENA